MPSSSALHRLTIALSEIEQAAAENIERSVEIQRRVHWFHEQIEAGVAIGEVVDNEATPRVVELISTNMSTLESVGAQFRAALALALREDGLTIEAIADLFGVTRQRISALLRQRAATEALSLPGPEPTKQRRRPTRRRPR